MKKLLFILLLSVFSDVYPQINYNLFDTDTINIIPKTNKADKDFLLPIVEVTGVNLFVNTFDRTILNADFSKISANSVKNNIKYGFVWDNDKFSTNLFAHPYHGNLYFNSARSNGLTFLQSAPYSFLGSLMWEFCGETEPAAINDLIATTVGGVCLGEITFRLSNLIIDGNAHGKERFLREFFATVISPMNGLNRLINSKFRKKQTFNNSLYQSNGTANFNFTATSGIRYLADNNNIAKGESALFFYGGILYGDAFDSEDNSPYDYFTADVTLNVAENQPLFSNIHILARLWGVNLQSSTDLKMQFGLFQNFNYYNSEAIAGGNNEIPFRISEAASLGTGFLYRTSQLGSIKYLAQRIFFNTILLGGSSSDYYRYIDRDYNMGSGFSARLNTYIGFLRYGAFSLNAEYYTIFTFKGYENKDYTNINPLYLNSQGDKSRASLFVVNPVIEFFLSDNLDLELSYYYFRRNTQYKYYSDVRKQTFEWRIGINWHG